MHIDAPQDRKLTQNSILSQNARRFQLKSERTFKLRWILAISCIPLFGIYAAFGIAPQTVLNQISTQTVIEDVSLPASSRTLATLDTDTGTTHFWYKEQVRRDDTMNSMLARLNIKNRDAIDFIRSDSTASEIASKLKPTHQIEAETDNEGNLIALEYQLSNNEFIKVTLQKDVYTAEKASYLLETRSILKSAEIKSSLFGATDAANIPDSIAIQVAEIFESEIDFRSDLRRGDQFNVIYEGGYYDGQLLSTGNVLAVEFINNHTIHRAVGFKNDLGEMHYYTPEGKSLHKSFLRSPLEFTRISSGFSLGRFHPVLQRMRAHKGIDMAAPTGTRIKAAGEAIVNFVGKKGGYGNVVVLKHNSGMSTVYGHLSKFAPGLHNGQKIAQGELIGFVGMSGLATGPHLHYEFLQNGQHLDPMKVALPKANPIPSHQLAAFHALTAQMTAKLDLLANSNIAALD